MYRIMIEQLTKVQQALPNTNFVKPTCSFSSRTLTRSILQNIFLDFKSYDGKTLIPSFATRSVLPSKVDSIKFLSRRVFSSCRSNSVSMALGLLFALCVFNLLISDSALAMA
jgi:hypothetical protein